MIVLIPYLHGTWASTQLVHVPVNVMRAADSSSLGSVASRCDGGLSGLLRPSLPWQKALRRAYGRLTQCLKITWLCFDIQPPGNEQPSVSVCWYFRLFSIRSLWLSTGGHCMVYSYSLVTDDICKHRHRTFVLSGYAKECDVIVEPGRILLHDICRRRSLMYDS